MIIRLHSTIIFIAFKFFGSTIQIISRLFPNFVRCLSITLNFTSKFVTGCRSCSFVDDILALHPRNKYFGGRNAYGIPLLQIYIQSISHPSPRYEKNIKILASQEHRVSRNETSIFELFSSYFSAIIFHFYRCYDDIYGKKTWRRETSKEQQQQRTPQLRPPPQGERTHHHRPPGWQR